MTYRSVRSVGFSFRMHARCSIDSVTITDARVKQSCQLDVVVVNTTSNDDAAWRRIAGDGMQLLNVDPPWRTDGQRHHHHTAVLFQPLHLQRHLSLAHCLNDSIFVPPASHHLLVVPRFQLDTYGRRTFAVAGSLHGTCSKTICVRRTCKLTVFIVHWRRFFLISTRHTERIRGVFATMRYINWHLHYITYFCTCTCTCFWSTWYTSVTHHHTARADFVFEAVWQTDEQTDRQIDKIATHKAYPNDAWEGYRCPL